MPYLGATHFQAEGWSVNKVIETVLALDVHKEFNMAVVASKVSGSIEIWLECQAHNTMQGMRELGKKMLALPGWPDAVVYETTGDFSKRLRHICDELFGGMKQYEVHALDVAVSQKRGKKTDRRDAHHLASVALTGQLETGEYRIAYHPDKASRLLQELMRHQVTLVREEGRLRNRIHKALYNMGLDRAVAKFVKNPDRPKGLTFLLLAAESKISDPEEFTMKVKSVRAGLDTLPRGSEDLTRMKQQCTRLINELSKKKKVVREILKGLNAPENAYTSLILAHNLRALMRSRQGTRKTVLQAEALVAAMPEWWDTIDALLSIPGVGMITAMAVIAEVGDFHRFKTARKLVSYAGLNPKVSHSGGTVKYGHISKQGNAFLRRALSNCVGGILKHKNNPLCDFYHNLRRRKGPHSGKLARIATAAKLLRQMWKIVTSREVYRFRGGHGDRIFTAIEVEKKKRSRSGIQAPSPHLVSLYDREFGLCDVLFNVLTRPAPPSDSSHDRP